MKNLSIIKIISYKKFKLLDLNLSYYYLKSKNSVVSKSSCIDFDKVTKLSEGINKIIELKSIIKFGEVVYFKGLKSLNPIVILLILKSVNVVLLFNIRIIIIHLFWFISILDYLNIILLKNG